MLFKLMKYDFRFSAKLFFILGATAIALAFISGIMERYQYHGADVMVARSYSVVLLSNIMLFPVAIAAIIHIGWFYHKSMFGRVGHLAMTMPINRNTLLLSKFLVSFIWFLYAVVIAFAMIFVVNELSPFASYRISRFAWLVSQIFNIDMLPTIIYITAAALFAISLLFFVITLANSVFSDISMKGLITGLVGTIYGGLYTWIGTMIYGRWSPWQEFVQYAADGSIWNTMNTPIPQTGLQYGRLVISQRPWFWHFEDNMYQDIFIDIYFVAFTIAAAIIAILATRSLLKSRVSI